MPAPRTHSVYVIALDPKVLRHAKFRKENSNYQPGKSCVYVGATFRTPDERFLQHVIGYHSCWFVEQYGMWLRRRLYDRFNPMPPKEAFARERQLAADLRKRRYGVWQK